MSSGMARRLCGGMSVALVGHVAVAVAQWLALALLARWTAPSAVGQYALALAICGPVILFTNLQLSGLQSTDAREAFSFAQYFALRLLMTLFAFGVILGTSLVLGFDAFTTRIVALLAVGKCCEAISDAVYGALMRRARFADVSRALTINAVLSLACFGSAAYLTKDVGWAVIGWSMGSVLTMSLVTLPTAVSLHTRFRWPSRAAAAFLLSGLAQRGNLRRLASMAWRLGLISTLLSLQANAPQYVLQYFLGASAVGTFAILAYPFLLGNIAVTAMGQAAAPQFADAISREDVSAFRRVLLLTTTGSTALGLVVVAATWFGGRQFLTLVYSAEYAGHGLLFTVLACSAAVRYAYLPVGVAATAQRRIGVQLWLRAIAIVVVSLSVTAGVLWRGMDGVGLALLFAAITEGLVWAAIAFESIRDHRRLSPAAAVGVS